MQNSQRLQNFQKGCSIKDLIVLLIAKENMPVRIVESPYFAQLLQGEFIYCKIVKKKKKFAIFDKIFFFTNGVFIEIFLFAHEIAAYENDAIPIMIQKTGKSLCSRSSVMKHIKVSDFNAKNLIEIEIQSFMAISLIFLLYFCFFFLSTEIT